MYDFHTHTFLSDGVLSPIELIRRALVRGYKAMAITDHVGVGNVEYVVKTLSIDCEIASKRWDISSPAGRRDYPRAEGRHRPGGADCQRDGGKAGRGCMARRRWSRWSPEPTRRPSARLGWTCWAHPGLITPEEARLAAERGVRLEVSARARA